MTMVDRRKGVVNRVAHAGLPIAFFESTRDRHIGLDKLEDFLDNSDYRTGECFFYPIEKGNRLVYPRVKCIEHSL